MMIANAEICSELFGVLALDSENDDDTIAFVGNERMVRVSYSVCEPDGSERTSEPHHSQR